QLNWKSSGINEFIEESMEAINSVDEVLKTMKHNLAQVADKLTQWQRPLMARKSRPVVKEEFEREHKNLIKERYAEIKDGGKQIQGLLKDTNRILRVSNASNDWRAYVDFVNNVVVEGLAKVVQVSLEYLLNQLDFDCIARDDK